MSFIFISYSHKDSGYAHRLAKELEQKGFSVWIDDRIDYGTRWPDVIEEHLDDCSAFVVIMTPRSKKSIWVQNELSRARRKGKKVFPLLLEGEEPWLSVEVTQYVDVRDSGLPPERFYGELAEVPGVRVTPPKPEVRVPSVPKAVATKALGRGALLAGGGALLTGGLVLVVLLRIGGYAIFSGNRRAAEQVAATKTAAAATAKAQATPSPPKPTNTPVVVPTATPYLTDMPIPPTPTLLPPTDTPTPVPPTDTPKMLPTDTPTPKPVAVVQAVALNVRSGPGTEYDVVEQVKQGDELEIMARTEEGDWLQVRLADEEKGWISAQMVEVGGEATDIPVAAVIPPTPTPFAPLGMVYVPAGEFTMASPQGEGDDDEHLQHTVYLDAFYIDKYEVTNAQFAQFLNQQGNQEESGATWLDIGDEDCLIRQSGGQYQPRSGYSDHPVTEVSWYGARAYCQWVSKWLPTEAEWEKAARGTDEWTYPWGEGIDCDHAQYRECGGRTVPVGSKPKGGSPYGALDMAGNVWEWVADWYDSGYYAVSPENNPKGPASGVGRVLRGGSWDSDGAGVRAANRDWGRPDGSNFNVGFRCVR